MRLGWRLTHRATGVATYAPCLPFAPSSSWPRAHLKPYRESTHLPDLDIDLAHIHTLGLAMAGRASISRVQRKVSLGPDVPACGLLRLRDGSLAYIVERFDRPRTGGKRRQEDFCQLAELSPKQKYEGSAELCVRLIRRFASEPGVATLALFRLLVFGWWTGNGDMHLKNLSLLTDDDGRHQLSPAYDLLCTRLVIADDPLALPVNARKERLDRGTWLRFAEYARIPPNAAARALALPLLTLPRALDLCERSFLPDEIKAAYAELLAERGRLLANI